MQRTNAAARLPPATGGRAVSRASKTFAPTRVTPDEAAFDTDLLDSDFYPFTDAETGQDSSGQQTDDELSVAPFSIRREPRTPIDLDVHQW